MQKVDIFEQGKVLSIQQFYMKDPSEPVENPEMYGPKIQGTYIGVEKDVEVGSLKYPVIGNRYLLSTPEGIRWVGFSSKKRINDDMKMVKPGQIIGFQHFGKSKMKDGTEFNNIKVIADPRIVDEAWLKMNPAGTVEIPSSINSDTPEKRLEKEWDNDGKGNEPFVSESSSVEVKLKAITDLAKEKLGVIDPMQVKDKVMDATNLAFVPANYYAIVTALEKLA